MRWWWGSQRSPGPTEPGSSRDVPPQEAHHAEARRQRRQRRSPHHRDQRAAENVSCQRAPDISVPSGTLAPPSQFVGPRGPTPLHGALGVRGRPGPILSVEITAAAGLETVRGQCVSLHARLKDSSFFSGHGTLVAVGHPACDIEGLAGAHHREEQRHPSCGRSSRRPWSGCCRAPGAPRSRRGRTRPSDTTARPGGRAGGGAPAARASTATSGHETGRAGRSRRRRDSSRRA